MVFYKNSYNLIISKNYFLKDVFFLFLILCSAQVQFIIFCIFRKYLNNKCINKKVVKIFLFYNIYKNFIIKIKQFFLQGLIDNFFNILKLKPFVSRAFLENKKFSKICWVLKKENFCIKFSFLHIFIVIDILKNIFFNNNNNFMLFYLFRNVVTLYVKYKTNFSLFNSVWYLSNLYMQRFEKFIQQFSSKFFLTNFSNWKVLNEFNFSSCLYYLYHDSNCSIYYVRSLNTLCFYLGSKVKYVFRFYKEIKFFLKYQLKIFLNYSNFSFVNLKLVRNKYFFNSLYYIEKKIKLRFFLLSKINYCNFQKKNFYNQYRLRLKSLTRIIIQVLLQYIFFKNNQKSFLQQLLWLLKSLFVN